MASRRVESLPQLMLGLLALAVAVVLGALFVSSAVKAVKRSRERDQVLRAEVVASERLGEPKTLLLRQSERERA